MKKTKPFAARNQYLAFKNIVKNRSNIEEFRNRTQTPKSKDKLDDKDKKSKSDETN